MNNSAAIGYMILAAKALGLDKKTIEQLDAAMTYHMDIHTEHEAEQVYRQFV